MPHPIARSCSDRVGLANRPCGLPSNFAMRSLFAALVLSTTLFAQPPKPLPADDAVRDRRSSIGWPAKFRTRSGRDGARLLRHYSWSLRTLNI